MSELRTVREINAAVRGCERDGKGKGKGKYVYASVRGSDTSSVRVFWARMMRNELCVKLGSGQWCVAGRVWQD